MHDEQDWDDPLETPDVWSDEPARSPPMALRLDALADLPARLDRLEDKLDQILTLLRGDALHRQDQGAPEE